jgi:hypothetical protein
LEKKNWRKKHFSFEKQFFLVSWVFFAFLFTHYWNLSILTVFDLLFFFLGECKWEQDKRSKCWKNLSNKSMSSSRMFQTFQTTT